MKTEEETCRHNTKNLLEFFFNSFVEYNMQKYTDKNL